MPTYLFIDGAYLRARLAYIAEHFSIDRLDFDYQAFSAGIAQKAFYYDCLPPRLSEEGLDKYNIRIDPVHKAFNKLRRIPGYHVFLGEAIRSGKTTRQKGVDIRIAVDMLSHSFRRNIDRAVLFTGDRDFEPLVSALVQEGIYVTVGYHPKSVSEELLNAADERVEYDTCKLWNLATPEFKRRFPAPEIGEKGEAALSDLNAPILQKGTFETEEVKLHKDNNIVRLYLPFMDAYGNKRYEYFYHCDEAVIMKLLDEKNIVVNWS